MKWGCENVPNNIHEKISPYKLAESMSINPKQCKNLKFFECRKLKLSAKLEIKLIDKKVAKEKLTDGQLNLLFSNQGHHTLDGTIHDAIFLSLRDTRAFLPLNYLETFSSISMEKFFHVYY